MFNILKEMHSVRSVKQGGEAALRENTRHRSPRTKSNLPLTAVQIYHKYITNILQIYCKFITNIFDVFYSISYMCALTCNSMLRTFTIICRIYHIL